MSKKNVVVGQSGGPSAVINASLCGILTQAFPNEKVGKIYGMRHGIEGLIKGEFVDLESFRPGTPGSEERLNLLKQTPASYLGSCRHKLKTDGTHTEELKAIVDHLEKLDIGYFFYIGGNDSMDTAHKLYNYTQERGMDIAIMGVPKTVDNDLVLMDHVPGYGSAAKYIAVSIRETLYDMRVYERPTVIVAEMMGRHAGWLTAAAALAVPPDEHDDLMIYLPETPFDINLFFEEVTERLKKTKKLLIAASEGLRVKDGRFVSELESAAERDAFGHAALGGCARMLVHALKTRVKAKFRPLEMSVLQRCAGHSLSLTDLTESEMAGRKAVEYAMNGESGKMVVFNRKPGDEYEIEMSAVDVGEISNKEKHFPAEWATPDRFVTADFYRYANPLIQGTPELIQKNGLPRYIHIKS